MLNNLWEGHASTLKDTNNSMAYEPESSMPYSQRPANNPFHEPNQPNSLFDTYFFKVLSNIILPYTPRPP